jgi:hypothetical protein
MAQVQLSVECHKAISSAQDTPYCMHPLSIMRSEIILAAGMIIDQIIVYTKAYSYIAILEIGQGFDQSIRSISTLVEVALYSSGFKSSILGFRVVKNHRISCVGVRVSDK